MKDRIAVDLDSTLAVWTGWKGIEEIGEPIPAMLQRVKDWLRDGVEVSIFTARVSADQKPEDAAKARIAIRAWLITHLGQELPITADKSMYFAEFWDDRSVQVVPNQGVKACDVPTPIEMHELMQPEPPLNLKEKTCLVVDVGGLFSHCAERLAKEFGTVKYHTTAWIESFSSSNRKYIGEDLPNVERVDHMWHHVDTADLIVFPDSQHGDLQEKLIKDGKRVWGARMGQALEHDRWAFRELLIDLGMPVAPAERIIGMANLKKYLDTIDECYIKMSETRGDGETWHYEKSESQRTRRKLSKLERFLGPFVEDLEFICEAPLHTDIEMGGDTPFVGAWPKLCQYGYEIKDAGFMSNICEARLLPEPIQYVNEKFAPVLKELGYRGSFSNEIRVIGKKNYFIDPTPRLGSPPSQVFWNQVGNWGEIMYRGAEGTVVEPKKLAEYGALAMIYCEGEEGCDLEHIKYSYPDKLADNFHFSFSTIYDGERYTIPQKCGMSSMGCITAIDDSPIELIKKLKDYASQLKGDNLDVRLDAIPKGIAEIHAAEKLGYKFGSGRIPNAEQVSRILT